MADNPTLQTTPATLPDGTVINMDDCSSDGMVQGVKLKMSADGSATPIAADSNGLEVQGAGTAGTPAGGVMSVQGVGSGTALPVSAASLPLPSGAATSAKQDTEIGSLANIEASTSVLDDWDESDRAKVNPIAGQAGVAAGAGAVSALTQRMTLASDDPAVTALQIIDDWDNGASDGASVSGDVAHDAADAGEPVKLGAKAIDLGANPTAVAAADRTNLYATRDGQLFTLGGHPNVLSQNLQVTDADGAQTDTAIITVSAGTAIVVTGIEVCADEANSVGVSVRIGFGSANTPGADAAGVVFFHPGMVAGQSIIKGNGGGILGMGTSGEDLRVTCEDPVSGSVSITVTYFTTSIG